MTQPEINTIARALGCTPETCKEAWACGRCNAVFGHGRHGRFCNCLAPDMGGYKEYCILPDPNSDDPGACVWDGFLLRAMGWPDLDFDSGMVAVHGELKWRKTTTAALLAAWQAREGK